MKVLKVHWQKNLYRPSTYENLKIKLKLHMNKNKSLRSFWFFLSLLCSWLELRTDWEWIVPASGRRYRGFTGYRSNLYMAFSKRNTGIAYIIWTTTRTDVRKSEQALKSENRFSHREKKNSWRFFRKIEGHHMVLNHELFTRKITETEGAAAPSLPQVACLCVGIC